MGILRCPVCESRLQLGENGLHREDLPIATSPDALAMPKQWDEDDCEMDPWDAWYFGQEVRVPRARAVSLNTMPPHLSDGKRNKAGSTARNPKDKA